MIWGQNEGYIICSSATSKAAPRKNALMQPIAAHAGEKRLLALAAYFAGLKWPNLQQPSAPNDVLPRPKRRVALHRLPRLPPRSLPGRRHHRAARRPMARLSGSDDD